MLSAPAFEDEHELETMHHIIYLSFKMDVTKDFGICLLKSKNMVLI